MERRIFSKVSSKGRVTLPVAIRKRLGLQPPDTVEFAIVNDQIVLRPASFTVQSLRGIVPPLPNRETTDFDDLIEEAMEGAADRIACVPSVPLTN